MMTDQILSYRGHGQRSGLPTVKDLERLALKCPTVKMCLDAWRIGELSFEQALVAMACYLAESNERLLADAVQRAFRDPAKSLIVESPK